MGLVLAIDAGTQSLRGCLFNENMEALERRKVSYAPIVKSRNQVEMDPETLWDALVRVCRGFKRGDRVSAVCFSTLCPSLLAMDSRGEPLFPMILHLDRRSLRQARWALDRVGEETFLNVAGNLPVPGGISVTSLLWIREHFPEVYAKKGVCFGHANTFLVKRLTGRFVMDPSNASFTGLYDTVGCTDWDLRLLDPLAIDKNKLPEVILSTQTAGELDPKPAALLGLPRHIPVVMGANDTTCAAVGAGLTAQGQMMNTSGTVEILVVCLEKPLVSRDHLLRTHAYPGKWLAMRTVGAGGASFEWFRQNFCREMTKEEFYEDYLKSVLDPDKVPGARFHPFLAGDRHRIRPKSGSFTRLSLHTGREDLLLALAHGIIGFQISQLKKWGKKIRLSPEIHHVGGGASQAYTAYKQALLPGYRFIRSGETTLKGAAMLAGSVDKRGYKNG